jgi:ubiquinone biosynthesis protein
VRVFRLLKILSVGVRFGLDQIVLAYEPSGRVQRLARVLFFWRDLSDPPAVRLRRALEALGPIFVKFGQLLSTRRDLLAPDYADELAKLQDRVPPFDPALALAEIESALGAPIDQLFKSFEREPVASASVAQVHFAVLPDATPVAVKVLRPGIHHVIENDIALLETAAVVLEKIWAEARRLFVIVTPDVLGDLTGLEMCLEALSLYTD